MRGAYRFALLCGALPLLVGSSIFLLWIPSRSRELMGLGVLVLFLGLAFFAIGTLALVRYCRLALRAPEPPRRFWLSALLCAMLLLANFPAAGAIVNAVSALVSRYTVVVRNESPARLEDVRVTGGGCEVLFETIPPGEVSERSFWVQHDGGLVLRADGLTPRTIVGYVTNSQGGHATATVHPDGTVTAVERD